MSPKCALALAAMTCCFSSAYAADETALVRIQKAFTAGAVPKAGDLMTGAQWSCAVYPVKPKGKLSEPATAVPAFRFFAKGEHFVNEGSDPCRAVELTSERMTAVSAADNRVIEFFRLTRSKDGRALLIAEQTTRVSRHGASRGATPSVSAGSAQPVVAYQLCQLELPAQGLARSGIEVQGYYEFDDENVQGEVAGGDGSVVGAAARPRFPSLVVPRGEFNREIVKSGENL